MSSTASKKRFQLCENVNLLKILKRSADEKNSLSLSDLIERRRSQIKTKDNMQRKWLVLKQMMIMRQLKKQKKKK